MKDKGTPVQVNEIIEDLNQKLYPEEARTKPFLKPVVHRKIHVKCHNSQLSEIPKNYVKENFKKMTLKKNYVRYDFKSKRASFSSILH